VKTANPLLVSVAEAGFQLDLPLEDIESLIEGGELTAVMVLGHVLVRYDSLLKFVRHAAPVRDLGGVLRALERA
jgi:hypothetical protein